MVDFPNRGWILSSGRGRLTHDGGLELVQAEACTSVAQLQTRHARLMGVARFGVVDRRGLPEGYDGGKKVSGRMRHLQVATLGLIWGRAVLAADLTEWDGAVEVFKRLRRHRPIGAA
jgi:hypothetical protein